MNILQVEFKKSLGSYSAWSCDFADVEGPVPFVVHLHGLVAVAVVINPM